MLWLANPTCAYQSSYCVNHLYDYRPSWTLLSAITIINKYAMLFAIFFRLYCCYFLFSQFFKRSLNPHTGYTIFLMEIFFWVSYYKKKTTKQNPPQQSNVYSLTHSCHRNKVKSVKNLNSNTTSLELMVSSYPTSILLVITEIKSKVLK